MKLFCAIIRIWSLSRSPSAFKRGDYKGQRYGQAFFNHFNLHKMNGSHRRHFDIIYNMEDDRARNEIALYIDTEN